MTILCFTNCSLCDNGKVISGAEVYVDTVKGKVVGLDEFQNCKEKDFIDLEGKILAPGFIDIQNNGIYGVNFSLMPSKASQVDNSDYNAKYKDALTKYLQTGVTSFCPTMTISGRGMYLDRLPLYAPTRVSDRVDSLGAHLEGPFISKEKKGCHPEQFIVDGLEATFEEVYGAENLLKNVAIVTVAPENPKIMDRISILRERYNLVVSIGHTTADSQTCGRALQQGASMITHLYNAMPQPHHRNSGVLGSICDPSTSDVPYFGLICDGIHVSPAMCVLAYRANYSKCILVTDAMHLFGLSDGVYSWDEQQIEKKDNRLLLEGTNTLAGAATELAECVRNLMNWSGISLAEAVLTVTKNPADALGISHKGSLRVGCDADMVVLNEFGEVLEVWKLGRMARPISRLSVL